MKIFRNKILMKIIVSICIVLTLMNAGFSNRVYADWEGILITPITKLLTTICDGIISILHKSIQYQDVTIIEISGEEDWWDNWGKQALGWVVTALVVAIAVTVVIATGGAAAAAGASVVGAVLKATVAIGVIEVVTITLTGTEAGTLAGQFVAERVGETWFSQGTLYMPAFTLTPETIFSNKVVLFDVNFFEPMEPVVKENITTQDGPPKGTLLVEYNDEDWDINQYETLIEEENVDLITFFDINAQTFSSLFNQGSITSANRILDTLNLNDPYRMVRRCIYEYIR